MPNHSATFQGDLLVHPAVKAWEQLQLQGDKPKRIELLQQRRTSTVYLLEGVGPDASAVIAKRSQQTKALTERTIYEEVLPQLPIPTLPYYGYVEEKNGEYGWLFLACAGGEKYSPLIEEHRVLAGRWLGLVHASAMQMAVAERLPERGTDYYVGHLQSAHNRITSNLTNPVLTVDDTKVLETIVTQCEVVVSGWNWVERLCERTPRTLIHGDFAPKNMHVRAEQDRSILLPFDWGSAGWGVVPADLVQSSMPLNAYWANPDLAVYHAVLAETWPALGVQDMHVLATLGKIFRCLVCIDLDAESLTTPWVTKSMYNMQLYMAELADAIQVIKGIV